MDATWEMESAASGECDLASERLGGAALPDVAAIGRAILSEAMSRTTAEIGRRAASFERIAVEGGRSTMGGCATLGGGSTSSDRASVPDNGSRGEPKPSPDRKGGVFGHGGEKNHPLRSGLGQTSGQNARSTRFGGQS